MPRVEWKPGPAKDRLFTPPVWCRSQAIKADVELSQPLFEPVFESQSRHFLEVSPIGREKKCVIGHRDAGHLQIHRTDFDARFAEAVEEIHRVGTQRKDVQLGEEIEEICQLAIRGNLTQECSFFGNCG